MTSSEESTFNMIYRSVSHEIPDLTLEERQQLEAVIQKAKEFDEEEGTMIKKPVEGQLYKYTNVMRGWQFRWFVLTPETGMLEYYMMDEPKRYRPKGGLHLAGAVITISDEDNNSFSISAICGEVYKLKAVNSKERSFWVNKLKAAAQLHSSSPLEVPNVNSRLHRTSSSSSRENPSVEDSPKSVPSSIERKKSSRGVVRSTSNSSCRQIVVESNTTIQSPLLVSLKEYVNTAWSNHKDLANTIEQLPIDGPSLRCSDASLLILKATSQATVQSLQCCYYILKGRERAKNTPAGLPPGATVQWSTN